MAPPGPMTSNSRGGHGFGFRHTATNFNRGALQTGRAYQPPGRDFRAPQSRFAVEINPNGATDLVLTEDEEVTVSTVDGEVVITISETEELNNLGNGNRGRSLGDKTDRMTMSPARPRTVEKMATAVDSDGVLVVRPNEGSTLHLVGSLERHRQYHRTAVGTKFAGAADAGCDAVSAPSFVVIGTGRARSPPRPFCCQSLSRSIGLAQQLTPISQPIS